MWKEFQIGGRTCYFYKRFEETEPGTIPTFFWLYYPHRGNELAHMEGLLEQNIDKDFQIIAIEVRDWNGELSPWPAISMDGNAFAGKGMETLEWIRMELFTWLKENHTEDAPGIAPLEACYVMGYSLAGLFSLWSLYESELFQGCICCSGSLWIDGWPEYVAEHSLPEGCLVYLSLGGKEEKTSNALMAKVGERTRAQEKILKKDPNVRASILEWNSGGHFADAEKRLLKGIKWYSKNRP